MPRRLRGDLQAAATILGYRPENRRTAESRRINLRGSSLSRAHLRSAHYEGMALTNADFRRAQLTGIHLNRALLRGARFGKAMLEEAHLTSAFLVGTDLCYARLAETDFEGAWLFGANLEGAQLDYGRLTGAYYEADLIGLFEVNRDRIVFWLPSVSSWRWRCVSAAACPGCRRCGRACAGWPGCGTRMPGGLPAWRAGSGSRRRNW